MMIRLREGWSWKVKLLNILLFLLDFTENFHFHLKNQVKVNDDVKARRNYFRTFILFFYSCSLLKSFVQLLLVHSPIIGSLSSCILHTLSSSPVCQSFNPLSSMNIVQHHPTNRIKQSLIAFVSYFNTRQFR